MNIPSPFAFTQKATKINKENVEKKLKIEKEIKERGKRIIKQELKEIDNIAEEVAKNIINNIAESIINAMNNNEYRFKIGEYCLSYYKLHRHKYSEFILVYLRNMARSNKNLNLYKFKSTIEDYPHLEQLKYVFYCEIP